MNHPLHFRCSSVSIVLIKEIAFKEDIWDQINASGCAHSLKNWVGLLLIAKTPLTNWPGVFGKFPVRLVFFGCLVTTSCEYLVSILSCQGKQSYCWTNPTSASRTVPRSCLSRSEGTALLEIHLARLFETYGYVDWRWLVIEYYLWLPGSGRGIDSE